MCTTFSILRNGETLLGRTMDLRDYHRYEFKYFPKNFNYEEDVFGNKLYTKYKIMGATFRNYDHLVDGINEKGLLGCTNSFRNAIHFKKEQYKGSNYKELNTQQCLSYANFHEYQIDYIKLLIDAGICQNDTGVISFKDMSQISLLEKIFLYGSVNSISLSES